MPRVAAKLDVSQISDISAVISEDTFEDLYMLVTVLLQYKALILLKS